MFVCSALNSTANSAVKELGRGGTKPQTKKNNNDEAAVKVFAHSVSCNTVELGLITVFWDLSIV